MFVTLNYAFVVSTNWVMKWALPEYGYLIRGKKLSRLTEFQESFNSRLKAEGDETSTNLYVSNLPRDMTESVSYHHAVQFEFLHAEMTIGTWRYLHGLYCQLQQNPP